ncbi:MAG: 2-dehydro-3-deoxygalactonokinase [Pseudomonadota bacterium]
MSDEIALICGNWGNTNLRSFALNSRGERVTEYRAGPGVLNIPLGEQADFWFDLTQDWNNGAANARHLLCGAVGSNIGWLHTGYINCPANLSEIAAGIQWRRERNADIGVVPGLAARTPTGEPDRLRGEETELLGWLSSHPGKDGLVCIPGTHCKWIRVVEGRVETFLTGFAGELFSLLSSQSILVGDDQQVENQEAFDSGLALGRAQQADLLHRLFAVRARQLSGELDPHHARDFLSGLIIGADVVGAIGLLSPFTERVTVIASTSLGQAYARAFQAEGFVADMVNALDVSVLGFSALQAQAI